jgi:glycosyltransferase involved in cell wall biosynthesis
VHFTGVVERDRVPSFVAAFDIAVQPAATSYASPLKLFEYLAAGCPIIAPRQPNVAEVLTDEVNALLFAPDEPQALANALERLVADPVLRERLGSAARATVKERGFTWLCNAERVVAEAQRLARAPTLAAHFTVPQDVEAS